MILAEMTLRAANVYLQRLPESAQFKDVQPCIVAEHGNIPSDRLSGNHAIKRIAMFAGQPSGAERVWRVDGQQSVPGIFHHIQKVLLQNLSAGKLSDAHFGSNLPRGSG